MTVFEKSLLAFRKYLKSVTKEELEKKVGEFDKINYGGPTLSEFFSRMRGYPRYFEENEKFVFQDDGTPTPELVTINLQASNSSFGAFFS